MFRAGRANPASGERNGAKKYPERMVRGDAHWTRRDPERAGRSFAAWRERNPGWAKCGSDSHLAKLDEARVRRIREQYATGDSSHARLAAEFGVTPSNIYQIVNHLTWRHIS